LAEYHVAADLAAGRLVRLFPDAPAEVEDVFAIYPPKLRGSARLKVFVDFLHAKFSSPTWDEARTGTARAEPTPFGRRLEQG
jgi:DNA-binding transcriptional LysR family regulator